MKKIFTILAACLAVTSSLVSCQEDLSKADPHVRYIRPCDPERGDQMLVEVSMGSTVAIIGEGLGDVCRIWFNDRQAQLNPTLITPTSIIVTVPSTMLTFYSLLVGSAVFLIMSLSEGHSLTAGIHGPAAWMNLTGLAVLPTIVSTATLAVATRLIGATKASVLGVFEPVTAILVGALAFGEEITTNVITGIILTMASITFMVISSAHKAER